MNVQFRFQTPDMLMRAIAPVMQHEPDKSPKSREGSTDKNTFSFMIMGEIGGWWGVQKKDLFNALEGSSEFKFIDSVISSPGGSVHDAFAMFDMIAGHSAFTTAYLSGECASAATLLACAFDRVVISRQCPYMIHKASWGTYGNADELRHAADILDKHDRQIVDVFARKTGLSNETILEMMTGPDLWLEADEALELGFVDEIVDHIEYDFETKLVGQSDDDFWFWNSSQVAQNARQNWRQRGAQPITNIAAKSIQRRSAANNSSNSISLMKSKFFDALKNLFVKDQTIEITDGKITKGGNELSSEELAAMLPELADMQASVDLQATQKLVNTAIANSMTDIQSTLAPIISDNLSKDVPEALTKALTDALPGIVDEKLTALKVDEKIVAMQNELAALKTGKPLGKPNNGNGSLSLTTPTTPTKHKKTGSANGMLQVLLDNGQISEAQFNQFKGK